MGFLINCTNKGCGKQQEPFLDLQTNEVHCAECDGIIANISPFAKNQMRSNKQIRKSNPQAFTIKCNLCKKEVIPKEVNNDIVCGSCNQPLKQLTSFFKSMLKENLKKAGLL